ncbi:MAG: hypothetical protein HOP10_08730 [Chitinophagaceae bacterium]|nr:hypothetical protein [Chitinophagaceae bacterium]
MKRSIVITVIFLLGLFYKNHGVAQKAETALSAFSSAYPSEKLYLHYDKEYYVAGETIWFKAYFYNNGKPSGISNNLYLQFIDSKGKIISDTRYPIMGAVAKGSVNIPDSTAQGNYFIRAFTPAMLNFDESLIYKKSIFVFKPSSSKATIETAQNVLVQFFPESGYLVDGIEMVTGFKATDQWGAPVEVKGIIKSDDGETITSFSSYHDGIGRVIFTPRAGKKYTAEVQTAAGPRSYPLPEVKLSGINLDVQDEKGAKKILLSRSEKDKVKLDNLLLVAEINNQVVFENEIAFESFSSVTGKIGTEDLPSGILHFTVFSKEGLPLAERLSFIDNGEYKTTANMNAIKFSAEKKALNEFEVSFPEIMQRSLSVSVTAASPFSFNDNDHIYSRFLLTGDLKGYVYNPAWYFEDQNDSTRMALDNLMITQGWSRFSWEKVLERKFPEKKYTDQLFISVSGTVKDEKSKEVLSGGKLNFFVEAEDSSSTPYEAMVDANGQFKIDSLIFSGKSKFFYAYTDARDKQRPALVSIDTEKENPLSSLQQNVAGNSILRNISTSQNKGEIDTRYGYAQTRFNEMKELERVTVQSASKKKPVDIVNEKYSSGVWRSGAKETLDNINEPANDKSLNVVDYIKNSIQQIELQNGQFVNRKNMSMMSGRKWIVGVFIDQVPSSIAQLRIMRVQDVALIKFYEAGFVGVGSEFPGGAIAVYTKTNEVAKPDKLNYFEYRGYAVTKEFYKPDYNSPNSKFMATDNRTTLYWDADTFTDNDTKSVKFSFFNNDFSRKFKVVVEGFDANGKLVHFEKIIGD